MNLVKTVLLLACCTTMFCTAKSAPVVYGGRRISLPKSGLKFVGFQHLKDIPKRPPQSQEKWKDEQSNRTVYGYKTTELWRFDQIIGIWRNREITLTVSKISTAAATDVTPAKPDSRLTTPALYNYWKQFEGPIHNWDSKDLHRWIELFTGTKVEPTPKKVRTRLYTLDQYLSTKDPETHKIYVLNSDSKECPRLVFHFWFHRPAGHDDKDAVVRVINSILLGQGQKGRAQKIASRFSPEKMTPKYRASRERAINSVMDINGWWYLESKNYIVVSNMKRKTSAYQLQQHLEKSRLAYQTLFPLQNEIEDVSIVKLFNTREEYISYLGSELGNFSVGVWNYTLKELVVSPLNWESRLQTKKQAAQATTTHEGFHQFIFYALGHNSPAPWFNEGTACFFEGISFPHAKTFRIGLDPINHKIFMRDLKNNNYDIKKFINYNLRQYYTNNPESNYALGWALMFYLYKGTVVTERERYRQIPFSHYRAMVGGKSDVEATEIAWKGIDMKQFTRDFAAFWNNKLMVARAKALSLKHVKPPKKRSTYIQVKSE